MSIGGKDVNNMVTINEMLWIAGAGAGIILLIVRIISASVRTVMALSISLKIIEMKALSCVAELKDCLTCLR